MQSFIPYLLYLHISAGFTALVAAPIAMRVKKGANQHRLWGKIYFWTMALVFVTAVVIAAYKPIPFLLMVAVLSFYLVSSGYRALYQKRLHKGTAANWLDWALPLTNAIFCVGLVAWGIWVLLQPNASHDFAYVAFVLGGAGILASARDIYNLVRAPRELNSWLLSHTRGFIGGYIATTNAFSAVNMLFLPHFIRWTWPTFIGLVLIQYFVRKYRMLPKKPVNAAAEALPIRIGSAV